MLLTPPQNVLQNPDNQLSITNKLAIWCISDFILLWANEASKLLLGFLLGLFFIF
jgi:hypothetical protein